MPRYNRPRALLWSARSWPLAAPTRAGPSRSSRRPHAGIGARLPVGATSSWHLRRVPFGTSTPRRLERSHQAAGRGQDVNRHAWTLAVISSPGIPSPTSSALRDIAQSSRIRRTTEAEARAWPARAGHSSTSVAACTPRRSPGSQHTIQLATTCCRAMTTRRAPWLDTPCSSSGRSINPDGQDIVVNWYRRNVGTSYELSPLNELLPEVHRPRQQPDAYMLNV